MQDKKYIMELYIGNGFIISFAQRFVILNLLLFSKVNAFENQELSLNSYNEQEVQDLLDKMNQTRKADISLHSYTKIDSDSSAKCDLR